MASYKKRGYKSSKKASDNDQNQGEDHDSTTAEVFETLDEKANKTEEFISKYQKPIFGVIIVIIVGVIGFLGYQKLIIEPNESEAANELNQAQVYFKSAIESQNKPMKDSLYTLAINGGNGKFGFVDIADQFGGTKSGNLANYYAGMSYFKLSEYKKAIEYLDDFKADDQILMPIAKGTIADAFQQIGQSDKALTYYEEAAEMKSNSFTTPKYLLKAGITAIELDQAKVALKHLNDLKEHYPDSQEAKNAEVYMGQANAM